MIVRVMKGNAGDVHTMYSVKHLETWPVLDLADPLKIGEITSSPGWL